MGQIVDGMDGRSIVCFYVNGLEKWAKSSVGSADAFPLHSEKDAKMGQIVDGADGRKDLCVTDGS